jgi:hypothetical protein
MNVLPSGDPHCLLGGVQLIAGLTTTYLCSATPASDAGAAIGTIANPAASCSAIKTASPTAPSGVYWVRNPAPADPSLTNLAVQVYCEQSALSGGWAMVYNTVMGPNTLDFWFITYLQRLRRRGTPGIDTNFYDGSLYQTSSAEYLDLMTDLNDVTVIAMHASSNGIDPSTMKFNAPVQLFPVNSGTTNVFLQQFSRGWSSTDFDGDTAGNNCALQFSGVTQHYGSCWVYNLGSDGDSVSGTFTDGRVGPHAENTLLGQLGLSLQVSGGQYSRVKRITRFVKW